MEHQESLQNEFGRRLRLIRRKRGLSQEQLALMCGLDRTYVSSVDRGKRNISLVNIWTLSNALKVNPSLFFVPEGEFNEALESLSAIELAG